MDHQMNLKTSELFGQHFHRLPLRSTPHITCGNALRVDWKQILPPNDHVLVLGNPPFVGAKYQDAGQKAEMEAVTSGIHNAGLLDYVTGWYFKAVDYISGTRIPVAFVSTNSITQGEQVSVLWTPLFQRQGVKIHFGYRTFSWQSDAKGKAHVHVVIIGWGCFDHSPKYIIESADEGITSHTAHNISPYLIEGTDLAIPNRGKPLCRVPEIGIGNKPIDDGNYLFTPEQKREFVANEPEAKPYFRKWIGSDEFINGIERWCLWLGECPADELRAMPLALNRVEAVRTFRLASKSPPTQKLAQTPTRFHVENFPARKYLVIPKVSSERRKYIPIGSMSSNTLASDLVFVMPNATEYHFGILSSNMHMAWVRQVCGRLESRYRYSAKLVYNNYPWPLDGTDEQKVRVEEAAKAVLVAREEHPTSTLADLYDPLTMPADLVKAHAALDRAVDRCYRKEPFHSDRERVEFLFALYEKLTAPLAPTAKPAKRRRTKA
jgi:hypothetical protein